METATAEIVDNPLEKQTSNIAKLPANLAVLQMENDNIVALAAAHPRDHKAILEDIESQLTAYPSFAKAAVYTKPVGKDRNTGQMKYARGLSIRAAEAIAEAYGYCRIRTDVTPIDDDTVKVMASFTDYQRGRVWEDSGIVSKWYTNYQKQQVKIPDDRFYNVIVKAEVSKRVREVITRSVPPGLRSELMLMADRRAATLLTDDAVKSIIDSFEGIKVSLTMLEGVLGKTYKHWTSNNRIHLIGIWTAIQDGETTVTEAFGEPETNGDKKAKKKKGAKTSDLSSPELPKGNNEQTAEPPKSAFELFKSDMEAAPDLDALTEIKNNALAEAQAQGMSTDEWKELQKHYGKLKESFEPTGAL